MVSPPIRAARPLLGAVVVAVIGGVVACGSGHGGTKVAPASTGAAPAGLSDAGMVLRDGMVARAIGEVVAPRGGAVQFCPPDRAEAAAAVADDGGGRSLRGQRCGPSASS